MSSKKKKTNGDYPSAVYEKFSKAEDSPGYVTEYLSKKIENKTILDLGCGTGKYIPLFAQITTQYIGLDHSEEQLIFAQSKIKGKNITLLHRQAHKTGLEKDSIDAVIATWFFESVRTPNVKHKILLELNRVLKKNGLIYAVGNANKSEFNSIISNKDNLQSYQTNNWLLSTGFKQVKTIASYFLFPTISDAKEVFSIIYGKKSAELIKDRKISHNMAIYKKVIK